MHCWSLSLEEQFYLFWPVFILFVRRRNVLTIGIACAAAASFTFAILYGLRDPQAVFFLMRFRIFEFAIGAAVIFIEPLLLAAFAGVVGVVGLLAVAIAFTLLDDSSSFALVRLLPSLGAAAVICAGTKYRLSGLLTNAVSRFLGRISYSLYLCHWPILFGAQVNANENCAFGISRRLPASLRPAMPFNCSAKSRAQAEREGTAINAMLREVQAKWPDQIDLLIPVDYFCDAECPFVRDGILLYVDDNHFSVAGARYIGERAHQLLARFLDWKPRAKQP